MADQSSPTYAYEDMVPGRVFDLGTVVAEREEMLEFAKKYDPQRFHVDEVAAAESVFGGLCASGWFTGSLWMRCYVRDLVGDSTSEGAPGGRELRWLAPVFPGDVLHCSVEVTDARLSRSRPGLGFVNMLGVAERDGERVFSFDYTNMFRARGPLPETTE